MSCAKDNRTLLWDLFSLKPVYELPPGAGAEVPVRFVQCCRKEWMSVGRVYGLC